MLFPFHSKVLPPTDTFLAVLLKENEKKFSYHAN